MLHREASADLQVRNDGRTVFGLAVPFNQATEVNDGWGPYLEEFKRGAFTKTIHSGVERVKFLSFHDKRSMPLGRASLLREDAAGLYGEFLISKTRAGDEAIELIRDGALDGFSVGFVPVKDRELKRGHVERLEVKLNEVSAVTFGAYPGALMAGVRQYVSDTDSLSTPLGTTTNAGGTLVVPHYLSGNSVPTAVAVGLGWPARMGDLTPEQLQRILDLFRSGALNDLLRSDAGDLDTSPSDEEEAVEAGDEPDEPLTEPEPPEATTPRHSLTPHQQAARPELTADRRKADRDWLRGLLAS